MGTASSTSSVPGPELPAPTAHRYDAFVSYAHAADGVLAPALRLGLERLTKPWYRRRALNVYLDSSSLEVTPALWGTISAVLADTGHLVVLCSPEAAASEWVDREVRWWLEHRAPDTILLGVTGGIWHWDDAHCCIAAHSSAAPPALLTAFGEEPRYLDLRWAGGWQAPDLDDDRFRDGVAQLAAAVTGRSKAEIVGEDVRQHRKTVRTAWSAVATLAVLLVVALVAGFVAKSNGDEEVRQRDVATSRLLAAQSASRQDRDPQLATLLALAAAQVSDTEEARAALLRMTERDKRVVGFVGDHAGLVDAAAFSPDGRQFATAGPDDPVRLWDTQARTVVADLPAAGASAVAFTSDGATLAVAEVGGVALWDVATRKLRNRLALDALSLHISADGSRLIGGRSDGGVVVVDLASGAEVARLAGLGRSVNAVALSSDGRVAAAGDFAGTGIVWDVATSTEITRTDGFAAQTKGRAAFSPDGRHLVMSGNAGGVLLLSVPDRAWTDVPAFRRTVNGLAFVDADTVFSSSIDGQVGLWSIQHPDRWELLVGPARLHYRKRARPGRAHGAERELGRHGRAVAGGPRLVDDGRHAGIGGVDGGGPGRAPDRHRRCAGPAGGGHADRRRRGVPDRSRGASLRGRPRRRPPSHRRDRRHGGGARRRHRRCPAVAARGIRREGGRARLVRGRPVPGRGLVRGHGAGVDDARRRRVRDAPATARPGRPSRDLHPRRVQPGRPDPRPQLAGGRPAAVGRRHPRLARRAAGRQLDRHRKPRLHPDGGLLAQGGVHATIVLWDPARPQEPVTSLRGQESAVTGLSFGPDGTLAAGTAGGSGVLIWDVARRAQQALLLLPGPTDTEPVFLPNSPTLLVTDSGGVHRYDLDPARLRDGLCAVVGRDLTLAEWSSYVEGQEQRQLCAAS